MPTNKHFPAHAVLILCVSVFLLSCDESGSGGGSGGTVVEREGNPDYVKYDLGDELMLRAYDKAKATYKQFADALATKAPGDTGFAIKKPYSYGGSSFEHIWITDVVWDGQSFSGTINNEPVDTDEVVFGQSVVVKPSELSDWMFVRNGVLQGGYTLRVMYSQMSEQGQAELTQQLGFTVPDVDF